MPSSVHKILLHGEVIIRSVLLPIGELSEEAIEARHKDFRRFRINNTRKCSRLATNEDIIHALLVSSDLVISGLNFKKDKARHVGLDDEAMGLLENFETS